MSKYWPLEYGYQHAEKKLKIYYSMEAYIKTTTLVAAHSYEIGWNMVVKPYKDGYRVEDVLIYPQKVSPGYIDVDMTEYGLWKANLTDDQDYYLCGQAHSHVNMATIPSSTDMKHQMEEVLSRKKGYMFYQIWNKQNQVLSLFYDIDRKEFFNSSDIELEIELGDQTVSDFVRKSFDILDIKDPLTDQLDDFIETGEEE